MKKTVDDKLNDIFDVQGKIVEQASVPAVVEQVKEPVSTGAPNDESIDADYEYARENLKLFIEQGKVAMENIIFLAKEGESPRAYEVVGQLTVGATVTATTYSGGKRWALAADVFIVGFLTIDSAFFAMSVFQIPTDNHT